MHEKPETTPHNTSGPSTPKPKGPEAAPARGADPSPDAARDFEQACRALEQIRSAEAMVIALIASLPDAGEMRVQVPMFRDQLLSLRRQMIAAKSACLEIGVRF
jgi:hypothetical protein